MNLQVQKGPHCLLYAAATILDMPPDALRTEIGYSGNEEWWPEAKFPASIRSFHIQEINDCFMKRGLSLSLIERFPRMAPAGLENQWKLMDAEEKLEERFQKCLQQNMKAILLGLKPSGLRHAVAFENGIVYDPTPPKGNVCPLEKLPYDFRITEIWVVGEI